MNLDPLFGASFALSGIAAIAAMMAWANSIRALDNTRRLDVVLAQYFESIGLPRKDEP